MNTTDTNHDGMNHNDDALLWQLRALRRDVQPGNDLWPGIAERINAGQAQASAACPPAAVVDGNVVALRRRRGPQRFASMALAASLVLAIGVAWQQRPDFAAPAGDVSTQVIDREADAMTREYSAALRELQASGTPAADAEAALHQLDQSAAQIRAALTHDPDARFLLERLRSTYEKRLSLTQRATFT